VPTEFLHEEIGQAILSLISMLHDLDWHAQNAAASALSRLAEYGELGLEMITPELISVN